MTTRNTLIKQSHKYLQLLQWHPLISQPLLSEYLLLQLQEEFQQISLPERISLNICSFS